MHNDGFNFKLMEDTVLMHALKKHYAKTHWPALSARPSSPVHLNILTSSVMQKLNVGTEPVRCEKERAG